MAAIHPPSNYCESVSRLAYSGGEWTPGQLTAFTDLMRGAGRSWDPDSRDALNWLFLMTTGYVRVRWERFSVEELERILAELDA